MQRPIFVASVAAALAAACGCGNSNGTTSGPAKGSGTATVHDATPPDAQPGSPMNIVTYRAKSASELALPLGVAAAVAEKAGAVELRVLIAPGTYALDALEIAPFGAPDALSVTVEVDGDGVVVLRGTRVSLTGKQVTLRGVVIEGARHDGGVLKLRGMEIVVERVALIGGKAGASDLHAPVVSLQAPRAGAHARLSDVWVVGNTTVKAPVISIPINGRSRFDLVELERVVLAGNTATAGMSPMAVARLAVRDALVVEPFLAGPWLDLHTFTEVTVSDALVAVRKGFVVQHPDDEVKLDEFPKVVAERVELRGPTKKERLDAREVSYGAAPAAMDMAWATDPARTGVAPDIKALRAALP